MSSAKEAVGRPEGNGIAHSALYGAINGIVAVPAMVSFVAIIYRVRAQPPSNLMIVMSPS